MDALTREEIQNIVHTTIKYRDRIRELYQNGVDLSDFMDEYEKMVSMLLSKHFDTEYMDVLIDFVYNPTETEYDYSKPMVWDDNGPLVYSVESLIDFLRKNQKFD